MQDGVSILLLNSALLSPPSKASGLVRDSESGVSLVKVIIMVPSRHPEGKGWKSLGSASPAFPATGQTLTARHRDNDPDVWRI